LRASSLVGELAFESVDGSAQTFEIYPAILTSLKLADCFLEIREGCSPFPQHTDILQTYVRDVNS
jgi:hypothetical protein